MSEKTENNIETEKNYLNPIAAKVHNKGISKIEESHKIALELIESKDEQDQALGSKKIFNVMKLSKKLRVKIFQKQLKKRYFLIYLVVLMHSLEI